MKSIENPSDADYGSRVLAAFRKKGLSTSQWNRANIRAMEKVSSALIEVIRTGTPEALVARLVKEKAAHDQMMAMVPLMFMHVL